MSYFGKSKEETLSGVDVLFSESATPEELPLDVMQSAVNFTKSYLNGVDPEYRDFVSYARYMIAEIGEGIRPYVAMFYTMASYLPTVDRASMSPVAEVEEIYRRNEEARKRAREAKANEQQWQRCT